MEAPCARTGRPRKRPQWMVEWGRSGKAESRNPDVHVCGESDVLVGPTKWANKVDEDLDRAGCAPGGGARGGKEDDQGKRRTAGRGPDSEPGHRVVQAVVRQAASRDRKARFTALLHHVTPELLQESHFLELKRQAAPGVDGMTWRSTGRGWNNALLMYMSECSEGRTEQSHRSGYG